MSSILSGGIYEKIQGNPDEHGIRTFYWRKTKSFDTQTDVQSLLVGYLANPMLKALNQNPNYNPFNGSVKFSEALSYIGLGALGYAYATKSNLYYKVLGNKIGRTFIAGYFGFLSGNIYRNKADHTGRKIKFKLY